MKKLVVLISAFSLSIIFSLVIVLSGKPASSSDNIGTEADSRYNNKPTVIIDAGHGGFDGGASSANKVPEKNINLNIALELSKQLKAAGYNTVMIRTEDVSVEDSGLTTIRARKTSDLHNRMKVMESTDNAIFVSIHQNHFSQSYVHGAQVFYSPNFSDESSRLAQCIQESITNDVQPDNTRVIKRCGTSVYLLYNAVKPAVLVECGFLSNPTEAENLANADYQIKIASAIANGITKYTEETGE